MSIKAKIKAHRFFWYLEQIQYFAFAVVVLMC